MNPMMVPTDRLSSGQTELRVRFFQTAARNLDICRIEFKAYVATTFKFRRNALTATAHKWDEHRIARV